MSDNARLLHVLAYRLYLSTLVGSPAPNVRQLGDRMTQPVPGDLVMEISTIYHDGSNPKFPDRTAERMGILLRDARELVCTPEEWTEQGGEQGEPIPNQRVFYLALPDGREYRWHNANFIAIPQRIEAFAAARQSPPSEEIR